MSHSEACLGPFFSISALSNVGARNSKHTTCAASDAVMVIDAHAAAPPLDLERVVGKLYIHWTILTSLRMHCHKCDALSVVCDYQANIKPFAMSISGNYSALHVDCMHVPSIRDTTIMNNQTLDVRDSFNLTIAANSFANTLTTTAPMSSCAIQDIHVCQDEVDRMFDAMQCQQRHHHTNASCSSCGNAVLNFGELCDNGHNCTLGSECASLSFNATTCECLALNSTTSMQMTSAPPSFRWWPIAAGGAAAAVLIVVAVLFWRRRQHRRRIGTWGVLVDEPSSPRGRFRAVDKPSFAVI